MDTTDVVSSYFMTTDMNRFAFMWLVYGGTNFSEWVQIFQKKLFREEPILVGSKLKVTGTLSWLVYHANIQYSQASSLPISHAIVWQYLLVYSLDLAMLNCT